MTTSLDRAGIDRPIALAVAAGVEADRGQAERQRRAGEVVMALLGRIGAVEDHDPGLGGGRQPQRIGETVDTRGLGGKRGRDGARRSHHIFCLHDRHLVLAALARVSPGHARQRARPPGARRLRRRRAGPGVRDAGLRRRRGRSAQPAPGRSSTRCRPATRTSTCCSPPRRFRAPPSTGCSRRKDCRATSPQAESWRWRGPPASIPARLYLHGNAKSSTELHEALQAGVGHVVIDSFDEMARLAQIAAEHSRRQDVLIRVTPDVAGDTHAAISTGQADSKFGFSIERRPRGDRPPRRLAVAAISSDCTSTSAPS